MILFHGTSSNLIPLILAEGLKDPHLTDDELIADYFAEEAAEENGGEGVILKIKIDDTDNLEADLAMYEEPLSFMLRNRGHSSEEEFWDTVDFPDNSDWEKSLSDVSSVRMIGTVDVESVMEEERGHG